MLRRKEFFWLRKGKKLFEKTYKSHNMEAAEDFYESPALILSVKMADEKRLILRC